MKKRRRASYSKRAVFKKRRRRASLILVLFLLATLLVLGGLRAAPLFSNVFGGTRGEPLERITTPTVEQAPEPIDEEKVAENKAAKEKAAKEEEEASNAPDDPTLYLTVPRLGIYHHTVRNDRSEAALDLGAVKLPSTGFPWQKGDTNTYIACHRLGWPGNESFHQCLNLPSMQKGDDVILEDVNGRAYKYRVSEFLQVAPEESWVTGPVAGRKTVSLQTCIETFGDFSTLGPNWTVRFVVRADRVA
jgi:sortase A